MSITGTPEGDPVKIGVPICDLVCGLYLALGVLAALRERDRTGQGQYLDVSLFESAVSLAVWEAGRYFATGEVGRPLGSAHQNQAPYQAVRSADGWVTVGAITPKTWAGFCTALGLDALRDDERYADSFRRHAHRDELIAAHRGGHHHAVHRGSRRAPRARRRAVRPDRRLRRGVHRRAPRMPGTTSGTPPHPLLGAVRQLGSPMRLSRDTRSPGRRPARSSGPTPDRRCSRSATRRRT